MAKIYPVIETNFNGSFGEKQIFEALQSLPDDWYVFHSVKWAAKRCAGNVTWGEADFVVVSPQFGILVIEVKSGQITCRDGVFYQKRLDTGEEFTTTPFEQADRSKYRILGELRKRRLADRCFIDKAVWFPSIGNIDRVTLPMEYPQELILTSSDLYNPYESLEKVFTYYAAQDYSVLSESDMQQILEILIPEFDLIPAFNAQKNEIGFHLDQLTDEQKKVLDFVEDEENIAICGAAGTGKTFIALERARRLCRTGKRVLFLCFNRQLCSYLQSHNCEEMVNFYTIHQFLNQQGMLPDLNEESSVALMDDLSFLDQEYAHIIIDEAQDFDTEVLKRIVEIAKREKISLTVFYDKNQLIIKDVFPGIINDFDCKLTLKRNCRNTLQIMDTSNSALNLPCSPSHLTASGVMPKLHFAPSREILLTGIKNQLNEYRQAGFKAADITILTLNTTSSSILTGCQRLGDFSLSDQEGRYDIQFTTARKFKGLENECIIIIDYDLQSLSNLDRARLFYVAASRARQRLDVFTLADVQQISKIGEAIEGVSSPTMRITSKTKMKLERVL